jgi:menaquinone-dependent protoporphyrinogen oxidase
MAAPTLVAYATTYGSTGEVAEAVAAALREAGLQVEVHPARKVRSLAGYGAVVLGVSLYMFRMHREARRFLSRHRDSLEDRPLAVFALGPLHDDEKEWQGAREQLDKELARYPGLQTVARQIFGGKFDPAKLRPPFSLLPAMKGMPASDIRDFEAIRAWAKELTGKLRVS